MKRVPFFLTVDVGTTAVKAIVFDTELKQLVRVAKELHEYRFKRDWVEQDPMEIVRVCRFVLKKAVKKSGLDPRGCLGLGMADQRETTIIWDKKTGKPVHRAIVWKDVRTTRLCRQLHKHHEKEIRHKTGLSLIPYFSATKIQWILDQVPGVRERAQQGKLLFGTVDTWVLWNLCQKHPHVTDETNAARTLLYNIQTHEWDLGLRSLFRVPVGLLPKVLPSRADFGVLKADIVGAPVRVVAVCGDQQASVYSALHALPKGTRAATKVTFGTGTFIAQVLDKGFALHDGFFTTVAPGLKGSLYVLEAKIDRGGIQVAPLLKKPKKLEKFLFHLAKDVDGILKRLPIFPQRIVVDGGVSRDGILPAMQTKISGVTVKQLPTFDGTSYGVVLLVRDATSKK